MRTYRELFQVPEFTPLFAAVSCMVAGGTVTGLALATLVFDRTGSALLAAVSMFGASFAQVIGATTLLSVGDHLPPRRTTVTLALVFAAAALALSLPGTSVPVALAIVLAVGFVNSIGGAVRWGLVSEILPEDGYLLGRSVLSMASGVVQILGNGVGAAVLHFVSPRAALVLSACLYLAGALVTRLGLTRRPARAAGRASVRQTWRVNRQLLSDRAVRRVYCGLWVPNGLVVGAEALFVPYAGASAGALFMAGALGMLVGDTAMGRFVPQRWRRVLITALPLLMAAPYLLFLLGPGIPEAVLLVGVASVGFSTSLLLQDRLVTLVPAEVRGQALGLHSSGMLTMQAVCAAVAGAVAGQLSPATTMALMAGLSVLVTAALAPGFRRRPEPVRTQTLTPKSSAIPRSPEA
ncbi:MFS transporter [Kitasatospora sp. MAP5-34]|uniref:MFS transporter n=1 Tax=Kitasatospora sp. MAP5-34 TaxID=3035102 RepID=UPI0024751A26|nr:MFS transporter [Kitasatospora sp. MAP5-34]MDH6580009.1 putative MFS family arabinose efflux permease [Kitasatospora sp. MAP5-34]